MTKKYNIIIILIMIIFTILVYMSSNTGYKEVDQEGSLSTTYINGDEIESTQKDETREVNNLLEQLDFSSEVSINEFIQLNNDYLAIGNQNNYPYMEVIKNINNNLILDSVKTDYTLMEGKIVGVEAVDYYLNATIKNVNNEMVEQSFFISKDRIIPFYKKQLSINYSPNITIEPKYFVIHETANTGVGADAFAHYRYWSTNTNARASTHFVVDSTQIYQMLELDQMAWHVGDNKGYSDIINSNAIGMEITVNSDGNYADARQHAIELTIAVMKELNMDISQLKMHHDASGKLDPITMLNDPKLWVDFVNQVELGLRK